MAGFRTFTNGRKAVKFWGGLKTFFRDAKGKLLRPHENGGHHVPDARAFRSSMDDYTDDEDSYYWASENEGEGEGDADNAPAAPETDPRRVIPPHGQRRQVHPAVERRRAQAYRYDISPNAPPPNQHRRADGRRHGPGPDHNPAFNRATNRRLLQKQQRHRDWRNERRDRYNAEGSPLGAKGRGSDVLAQFCADADRRGLMGERMGERMKRREEGRDEFVTDITTRPPPKFDLGPAAARSSETPWSQDDPFGHDAAW